MATLVHMHGHSIHAQLSNHFCHPNHVVPPVLWRSHECASLNPV